ARERRRGQDALGRRRVRCRDRGFRPFAQFRTLDDHARPPRRSGHDLGVRAQFADPAQHARFDARPRFGHLRRGGVRVERARRISRRPDGRSAGSGRGGCHWRRGCDSRDSALGGDLPRAAASKNVRFPFPPPRSTQGHQGARDMKADNVLATIGNTPHIRLSRLFPDHEVWVKSERANPGGSIKDRIALAMVEDAEKSGALKPGGTIIEPTSGNTGIGLAMVAAVKGYKLVLVMPESMSLERRRLMLAYGATFALTPKEGGMKGAIARAKDLVDQTSGAWMPQQFD